MTAHKLTKRSIEDAKPATSDKTGLPVETILADGNTLYLRVRRAGSKQFVQIVRIDGKRYERSLGGWPKVGLAEARDIAHDNCRKVRHGENPFATSRAANDATTFEDALEAVLAMQSANWRGTRTEANWRSSMDAAVMDWAIASGHRKGNPAAAVDAVLPRNGTQTTHLASLQWRFGTSLLAAGVCLRGERCVRFPSWVREGCVGWKSRCEDALGTL